MRNFVDPMLVVGFITIVHGLAHLVPVAGEIRGPTTTMPWVGRDGSAVVAPRAILVFAFSICALGFVLGGLAAADALVGGTWWRPFTDSAAVFSTIALLTFPKAFPPSFPYRLIGLGINVIILGNWLQIWDWPL